MAETDTTPNEDQEKALDALQREVTSRFEASDREEEAFRKEMANLFDRFEAKIMSRFDDYDEHTTQIFEKLGKELAAKFDSVIEKAELLLETMRSQREKAELWLKTMRSQKKT